MHYIIKCANPKGNSAGCFKPTWRNWQTRTVQVRVPQGLWVRLPPSVPFSLQAGMAYRLCTSLPSWLEGFDPPYPLHFFGGIPERPKGADCKSASTSFDGSNPSPTTILKLRTSFRGAFFLLQKRKPSRFVPLFVPQHRGGEMQHPSRRHKERCVNMKQPQTIPCFG